MADHNYHAASGSAAENLFIDIFADTFGAEKAGMLCTQYHFYDIYNNDFFIENGLHKIAIEVDDEASHNKNIIAENKFCDDLLKQNSMIYLGWDVYRWAVRQLQNQPDNVRDELRVFLGTNPSFREVADYLPAQRGKAIDCDGKLELKAHQKQALDALQKMRDEKQSIALLFHATGTGKTVTAVSDANLLSRHTTLSKNYGTKLTSGDIMRISNSQIHSLSAEAYRALRLILNNSGIPTSVISLLTKHTMLLQKHIKRSSHISSRNLPSDLPQHRNVQTIRTYLRFFAILPTSWISRPLLKSENLSPCDV